jgi:glycerophosphoryl diester phosphodiesterase
MVLQRPNSCVREVVIFKRMNILLDRSAHPVIGHRGNRAHSPEDTRESVQEALALGVDAVEFDLHVTRDGQLVVVHDPTVERTTDGHGAIASMTVAQLKEFDAGANFTKDGGKTFPWRGRGVEIPTFDEMLDVVRDVPMIIELKTPAATELARAAITRRRIEDRVVVAGFDSRAVYPLRGANFPLGATTRDALALLPRAFMRMTAAPLQYHTVNIPPTWHGLPVPMRLLSKSLAARGTPIHVWTVNHGAEAKRLWDMGVSGIISDDPTEILDARNAWSSV